MALSTEQLKFLARRLLCKNDTEAAEQVGIHRQTVYAWKIEDPEFLEKYNALGTDGVELARSILRQHLGEAAQVLAEGMRAKDHRAKPDHPTRIIAAKTVLQSHGVIVERREHTGRDGGPIQHKHEHSIDLGQLSDEDLNALHSIAERAARPPSDPDGASPSPSA